MTRGQGDGVHEETPPGAPNDQVTVRIVLGVLSCLLLLLLLLSFVETATSLPAQAQDIPTLTPTPTATRPLRVVTELIFPQTHTAVAGTISILGSALLPGFRRYELHIAVAASEDWRWLQSSDAYVSEGELYRFDTTRLPDGFYDLRLRAINDDGNYDEAFVNDFEIRNANPPTPTFQYNSEGTPLPTETATPEPSTATPEPDFVSFIPNGPGIFVPLNGGVLRGQASIIGTANGSPRNPFARFELYLSQAGYEDWQQLLVSEAQFWQNTLYVLDTTQYPDGLYDLRLRIVHEDANYDEYEVHNVYIANYTAVREPTPTATPIRIGILRPRPNENVSGLLDVIGAANTANFASWELAWRPSGTQQWTRLLSNNQPVPAYGLLATLDLNQLPVGAYDFRLRVVNQDGSTADFIVPQIRVARPPVPATLTPTPFG